MSDDFIKSLMQQVAENFTKNSGNPDAYIARKQDWANKVVPAKLPGKAVKLPELDEHGVYKGKPAPPGGGGKPVQKGMVVHTMTDLAKGKARGGKYYRRTPTGIPERPWRYWYSKEEYEKEHGDKAHLHGPDVKQGSLNFDAPEAPAPTKSFTVRYTQNGRENRFMFGAAPAEAQAHALASLKANLRGEFQLVSVLETVPEDFESKKRPSKKVATPREDAEKATKAMVDSGEYVNDRKSKIEQRGEDVFGSARHKAAEWKSAREAAGSEHAEKMFTRDFLTRQSPTDWHSAVTPDNAATILLLATAARKFEAAPSISWRDAPYATEYHGDRLSIDYKYGASYRAGETVSKEEHTRRQRLRYHAAYEEMKGIFEKHIATAGATEDAGPAGASAVRKAVLDDLRKAILATRLAYGDHDAGANAMIPVFESLRKSGGKTSAAYVTLDFMKRAAAKFDGDPQKRERIAECVRTVLDGKSMNAALGEVQKKTALDESSFYGQGPTERTGPASEYKDPKQGLDLLDKSTGGKYQMRAVQWGKSVTDEERAYHLRCVVDSFRDLTDVLGLPPEMASYNGRLGLAIGARGKSRASAHYEPSTDMINLTRASGVGTLAHEWGHFFDYTIEKIHKGPRPSEASRYSEKAPDLPVTKEMHALFKSPEWYAWRLDAGEAVNKMVNQKRMSWDKGQAYWLANNEMWARTFERYVQHKLHKAGRANPYLSGFSDKYANNADSGLWPSEAHIEALAPHIDKIFDAFRNSDLIKKALVRLANGRPVRVRSMSEL